jgi:hypothetical protein
MRFGPGFLGTSGAHGLPVRSSMYWRMRRLTTCDGVVSSSAHSRSKSSFLRGSIRIVRRAVRSSMATENYPSVYYEHCMIMKCTLEYNRIFAAFPSQIRYVPMNCPVLQLPFLCITLPAVPNSLSDLMRASRHFSSACAPCPILGEA